MNRIARLAGALTLLALSAAVWAAGLTPAQVDSIKRGMTVAQVQELLGKPARTFRAAGLPDGQSWVYTTQGGSLRNGAVVEIDFSEGHVVKVTQRYAQDFD